MHYFAALFTIAKITEQPKCPLIDKMDKENGYACNGILFEARKIIKSWHLEWEEQLEDIILFLNKSNKKTIRFLISYSIKSKTNEKT